MVKRKLGFNDQQDYRMSISEADNSSRIPSSADIHDE